MFYTVRCDRCSSSVRYSPSQTNLQETTVTLTGLVPRTSYKVEILAENGVSSVDPVNTNAREVSFITLGSDSETQAQIQAVGHFAVKQLGLIYFINDLLCLKKADVLNCLLHKWQHVRSWFKSSNFINAACLLINKCQMKLSTNCSSVTNNKLQQPTSLCDTSPSNIDTSQSL